MLTINVNPGTTFPDSLLVDRAMLRLGANPSIEISGTVESSDLGDAAVKPVHLSVAAFLLATTSGTGAAFIATSVNTAAPALVDGMWAWVVPHTDNTGTCTLNLDGLGAKTVLFPNGANLAAYAIKANTPALLTYHSTPDAWVLSSMPGNGLPLPVKGSLTVPEVTVESVSTIKVVADSAILTDPSTGAFTLWSGIDKTANIAVSGAGGLDVGSEAATTKYYLYLVSDGSDLHAILSTSGTAPDKTNFTWTSKLLVGAVYNDTGYDFSDLWCDWPTPRFVSAWTDPGLVDGNKVTHAHNLGRAPKNVRVELKCVATGAKAPGYAIGDILDSGFCGFGGNSACGPVTPIIPVGSEITEIDAVANCTASSSNTFAGVDGTTGAPAAAFQLSSGTTVYWYYRLIVET